MKPHNALAVLAMLSGIASAQPDSEFEVYPNGLIYSESAMSKLGRIVDSLNLRFKQCDIRKRFYSLEQTVAHVFRLDSGDIRQARKLMDKRISFNDLVFMYPAARVSRDVLVLRNQYTSYEGRKMVNIAHVDPDSDEGLEISSEDLTILTSDLKGRWIYEYHRKSRYSDERLDAFFFPASFVSRPIPEKYAAMIAYGDCLVDTTVTKFREAAGEGTFRLPRNWQMLPLEKKRQLLERARSTHVVGYCSMDTRPRDHARNVALLAAESISWEIFLRSHLDIMNDRFDRMSDGSYAWAGRSTYIKELEVLNIEVLDLLLGSCLRAANASSNHYYGSISRMGRALSETKNREAAEATLLSAVSDPALDDYNRLLFYWLFRNYTDYLTDDTQKHKNKNRLNAASATMPEYMKRELIWK